MRRLAYRYSLCRALYHRRMASLGEQAENKDVRNRNPASQFYCLIIRTLEVRLNPSTPGLYMPIEFLQREVLGRFYQS